MRGIPALFRFKNGQVFSNKFGDAPKAALESWIKSAIWSRLAIEIPRPALSGAGRIHLQEGLPVPGTGSCCPGQRVRGLLGQGIGQGFCQIVRCQSDIAQQHLGRHPEGVADTLSALHLAQAR
jgi:hypothetical protein